MANLSVPVTFTQYSPYVRGNVIYRWFDTSSITGITGGNASADGIVSITADTVAGTATVQFDSNVNATVDIAGATSTLALVVADDYNDDIYIETTFDAEVGTDAATTSAVVKKFKHTFVGISDSVVTSTPADPQFNETEIVAGTTKSLGTFSVNDVDSGARYTATITYDKTLGSITYTNPGGLTIDTSNSGYDTIVSDPNYVAQLNACLSDMQYIPIFQSSPATNTDALQGQSVTLSLINDSPDYKIQGQPVASDVTIDTQLQYVYTGPAPSFTENEGSAYDAVGKSLGVSGISPTLNIPGVTFKANVSYDHSKGTITYPNPSIVTTQGSVDIIASSDIADVNDALSNSTYVPTTISSGEDLERIVSDSINITTYSDPQLSITNPGHTLVTTVSNDELEIENANAFTYVENTTTNAIFPDLGIIDTADANAGTTEIYAMVFKPNQATLDFIETYVYTVALYQGNSSTTNIPDNSYVIQGTKQNINDWLEQNEIRYNPVSENTATDTISIDLYRAPDGTAYDVNINNDVNFALFDKIHQGDAINITNTGTVTTMRLQDHGQSTMNYNTGTNAINSESFVEATTWGALDGSLNLLPTPRMNFVAPANTSVKLAISTDSTLNSTEFGNIGSWNAYNETNVSIVGGESFDAPTQTYTAVSAQGNVLTGGDGGLNTFTHQAFRDYFYRHNAGTLSDASDEQTANLTYTVSTIDNSVSSSLTIPYLIVKNGSTDGDIYTTTSAQPFPNDNEVIISMWVYTPSDMDVIANTSSSGILFQAGDQSYVTHPYFVQLGYKSTGYNPSPGVTEMQYQYLTMRVQQSATEGFFADAQISASIGQNRFNVDGWNHIVWAFNLDLRDWECAINGASYNFGTNLLTYPTTWATGLSNTTRAVFNSPSTSQIGHIQITDDFEAGDIHAGSNVPGPKYYQFATRENTSSGTKHRPTVRTGMHGFINGSGTSFRMRGNIGDEYDQTLSSGSAGNLITYF